MLRSALEAMQEATCLCDEAGAVLYMNSAAKELTGWQEGSALDKCCRQILDNVDAINNERSRFSKSVWGLFSAGISIKQVLAA